MPWSSFPASELVHNSLQAVISRRSKHTRTLGAECQLNNAQLRIEAPHRSLIKLVTWREACDTQVDESIWFHTAQCSKPEQVIGCAVNLACDRALTQGSFS